MKRCCNGYGRISQRLLVITLVSNAGVSIPLSFNENTLTAGVATQKDWSLHEILLAGWGCPIGELFDLEKLAEQCKKMNRWSFFVTSEVCNVSLQTSVKVIL